MRAFSKTLRMLAVRSKGDVLVVERDVIPVKVASEEREQWFAWFSFMQPYDTEHPPHLIPEAKPYFRALYVDQDDRLWVQVYVEAEYHPHTPEKLVERGKKPRYEWTEPQVWDVFNADGEYVTRVRLPNRNQLIDAHGDHVWSVERNASGGRSVVRYRME